MAYIWIIQYDPYKSHISSHIYICTPRIRFVRCTSKFSKCLKMPVGSAPWYAAFTSRDVKGAGLVFESYIFIR